MRVEGAIRTRDALQRAAEGAVSDAHALRARHAAAIHADVQQALQKTARDLAQRARATSALFTEYQATEADLRRLTPPPAPEENTGQPQDSALLIGPLSRTNTGGPNPGQVAAILDHLASLDRSAEAETVIGESPGQAAALSFARAEPQAETIIGAAPDEGEGA